MIVRFLLCSYTLYDMPVYVTCYKRCYCCLHNSCDPGFLSRDLARYRETGADEVRRLAAGLARSGPVALSIVPDGGADRALAGSVVAEVS